MSTPCSCPFFDAPIEGVTLDYVFRREREGDYLARLVRPDGVWRTGTGPTAKAAVAAALARPVQEGQRNSLVRAEPGPPEGGEDNGPATATEGCPA